jgi:hypothetical protein
MQALISWSSKYPALVQNLGSSWFTTAKNKLKECTTGARFLLQAEYSDTDSISDIITNWKPSGFAEFTVTDSFSAEFAISADGLEEFGESFQFENIQNSKAQYTATPSASCSPATLNGEPELTLNSDGLYSNAGGLTPFQIGLTIPQTLPGSTVYKISGFDCVVNENLSSDAFTIPGRAAFIELDLSLLILGESRIITDVLTFNDDGQSMTITITRLE